MSDNAKYELKVMNELDIEWQMQNQIHKLLNIAYQGLTKQFICKTYAYMRPDKHILIFSNDILVGHCGLIENEITNLPQGALKVGGIGLIASLAKSSICRIFLQKAIDVHAENGLPISVGYTGNRSVIKHVLSKISSHVLDIPTIGVSSQTKPTDKTVIMKSNPSTDVREILALKEIKLAKEIF